MEIWENLKEKIKNYISFHSDDINAAGAKFDTKVASERKQYQEMGGLGEYITENAISALSKASKKIGKENWGKFFEEHRADVTDIGKSVDNRIMDEFLQCMDMGGVGEYIAQNVTSVLSKASQKIGKKEWAEYFESHRDEIRAVGKAVDDKIFEEIDQFREIGGVGEYVAQNAVSVLSWISHKVGREDWAAFFEENRDNVNGVGKAIDSKISEEYAQYQEMGGAGGRYLAQNLVSLLSKASEKVGKDDWKKFFEEHREDVEKIGENFDSKMQEQKALFNKSSGIGGYLATLLTGIAVEDEILNDKAKENMSLGLEPNIKQENPIEEMPDNLDDLSVKKVSSDYIYHKAEILSCTNKDGSLREVSLIDGQKHGGEIVYNPDKSVREIKLYNHGQEIDLEGHTVEVKRDEREGCYYEFLLLDGKPFGTNTCFGKEGNTLGVTFYELNGVMKRDSNSELIYTHQNNRDILVQDIANQTGVLPENLKSEAQSMRFDKRLEKRTETEENTKESVVKVCARTDEQSIAKFDRDLGR